MRSASASGPAPPRTWRATSTMPQAVFPNVVGAHGRTQGSPQGCRSVLDVETQADVHEPVAITLASADCDLLASD